MLYNPNSAPGGGSYFTDAFEAAAPQFSIQAIRATVQTRLGIEKAISMLGKRWRRRSYCCGRTLHECASLQHTELTSRYRLPTTCPYRFYAANGCLLVVWVWDLSDHLSARRPTSTAFARKQRNQLASAVAGKFELAINVETAKSLDWTVSTGHCSPAPTR